jgi:hypothetical protein
MVEMNGSRTSGSLTLQGMMMTSLSFIQRTIGKEEIEISDENPELLIFTSAARSEMMIFLDSFYIQGIDIDMHITNNGNDQHHHSKPIFYIVGSYNNL